MPTVLRVTLLCVAAALAAALARADDQAANPGFVQDGAVEHARKLLDLDIDQLANTPVIVPSTPLSMDAPVTSVAKEQSTVGHSAAAVFVITQEMIRRSGATSIPEVLRMAPGVEVARINSNAWAISARGFNSFFAKKLLVLIDGRSVYDPNFSGVFWNVQDVLLEDVERIEVVRGPGGTLWGANAVNGVINILTKTAKDSQGTYVSAGGGTQERFHEGMRYGGRIGEDLHYRVYGKYFDRGPGADPQPPGNDAWQQGRFGFRADWEPGAGKADNFTVQGDHYDGNTANGIIFTAPALGERQTGENVLARWRHVYDGDRDWTLQTYYDRFSRICSLQTETVKTFDVEFQCRFPLTDRQSITCGAGFRNVESLVAGGDAFTTYFPTPFFTTNYTNQFVQDAIALVEDRLTLTLGIKLEQNPYTGLEYQPTARFLWTPDERHSAWAAVSRAVRTPSRAEEQVIVTLPQVSPGVFPRAFGNGNLVSEDLLAYEIGYRTQAGERLSWDIAAFYNTYDHLLGVVEGAPFLEFVPPPPHAIVPLLQVSDGSAQTYGVELAANYSISQRWRLYGQYTCFQMRLGSSTDPKNQVYLRSSWDLGDSLEFDLMARYVDRIEVLAVPRYLSMDLRLGWRPREHLELAVVGQNLLQDQHVEFVGNSALSPGIRTGAPRGVYGTLTWTY